MMFLSEDTVESLLRAIGQQDMVGASLVIAGQFAGIGDVELHSDKIQQLALEACKMIGNDCDEPSRFDQFIDVFYKKFAFSADETDFFNSRYSLLDQVLDYRTGIPVTLGIIFCALAKQLGFEVEGINFPGHFLIRFKSHNQVDVFIDPLNGKPMSKSELEVLYFSIVGETDVDAIPNEVMQAASVEEIVIRLLHNLKASFIREQNYQKALGAVEMLINLCPNDPYERRDRGFLLHQLDCPQVAKADYQFFIKHCPQDPAAQLLKLQMRHWDYQHGLILH
ncbi:tetratricopeptide repeat protein [Aliiglaciecola sp. LCG003]|uniref:SirB1 family protein n=1 Tax=Aliiglaciecola sp. LCG003 TaxID=3053655 RepID=UPI002572C4F4|nr:tetratricopeptide repeat protein [Aliiglaciecola sp. LCG003]WJG08246.1 tetratricopeptide repeat protein [Aliiglaciecola sp. LCG003]